MNRDQIIGEFVKDKEYRAICRQVAGNDADDLYQELALIVLELPDNKLNRLNETCLKCFFYRMAQRQYVSTKSAFYQKYKKPGRFAREHAADIASIGDDTTPQEVIDEVVAEVDGLYWYDKEILALYAEKGSMREVATEVGIPLMSIFNTIKGVRKVIKTKLSHDHR